MAFDVRKIYAVWLREVKRFINSKARIVGSLGQPILFLVALGGGFSGLIPKESVPGSSYTAFLLPGILAMTVMFTSIFAGVSIIWDREFGFLKEMLAAPTSRETIVLGRVLGGATSAIFQGTVMLALGLLFTGIPIPANPLNLAGIFLLMVGFSASLVATGIALASLIREVETFQLLINFLIMPLFFLSSALFPIESMPDWMQYATSVNPVSYAVDGMRALLVGTSHFGLATDFGVTFGVLAVMLVIASYLFNKTSI